MFKATYSIASAVSSFSTKRHQTIYHVSASPPHPAVSTHVLHIAITEEKSIIDQRLKKSSIFVAVDVLLLSGRSQYATQTQLFAENGV